MELLFDPNYFSKALDRMNYDALKLPVGKLSQKTLLAGMPLTYTVMFVLKTFLRLSEAERAGKRYHRSNYRDQCIRPTVHRCRSI